MVNEGKQTIACSVTSCQYNAQGDMCRLNRIQVAPKQGVNSGRPEESLCASYRIEG